MHASPEDIAHAIGLLRAGRLVAFPTETVYGLGADAMSPAAVAAVFAAKGRPASNPLIVHVADEVMARSVCAAWPAAASRLAAAFWPGPLTLVLPKSDRVPEGVTAGGPTVAVRCPSHPLTLALIDTFGSPLVGPSANRSGHVSPTSAAHVRDSFNADEVFVLDGGACVGGLESTVIDLTVSPPRLLRPGLVTAEDLQGALGSEVQRGGWAPEAGAPARSPGQQRSHYAPRAPVTLTHAQGLRETLASAPGPAFVLGPAGARVDPPHVLLEMPAADEAYAARLYAALREADEAGAARILIVRPWAGDAPSGVWAAVADRLERAAAPRGDREG